MQRFSVLVFVAVSSWAAVLASAAPPDFELSAAEEKFAKTMSHASLVGAFTVATEAAPMDGKPPRSERYDLGEVRKVGDDLWLIAARIRYGQNDVTLPITLPVKWAGDVAVIVVDKMGFPGLGTYSARVMIHDGKYAGYWHGGGHGGHLFGDVQPTKPVEKAPAEP